MDHVLSPEIQAGTAVSAGPTPHSDGFRLPARFCAHQRTLMSWPCREDLFGPLMGDARCEWAEVARGIARFEPITVVVDPTQEAECALTARPGRRDTRHATR